MGVFIGRQPIFNAQEQVVAYELLYRNSEKNSFPMVDPDTATVDVLVNSFLSIGIDEVTKGKPSFVNFTKNLLMDTTLDYINPSRVVIEVLEDVPITEELVQRIIELRKRGFKVALDDFVMNENVHIYNELFANIDYIKIDFILTPLAKRMEIENNIKTHFPSIQLLAEKVETRNEYEVAKHSGYVLFQGYFFEQPQVIKSTEIPANTLQYFQIISLLRDEEPNMDVLAENIEREISLTYRLLQLINNSSKRTKSKVRSIKQAILLLGLTELRKWIYLLAMREINVNIKDDVFIELMRASLFRAKVCEKIARVNYKDNFSEYFLIGLFSLIDSLLKRPMNSVLRQLPLSENIVETISGVDTEMQPYLQFSIALSKLDWPRINELAEKLNIPSESILPIYKEVKDWVADAIVFNP
ncbi:EAL domain-containing protein [Solibacillus sp. R5-41]|uniref:EAL and HDOD domain-containing protein n=1 Tax=Solibacillus sp. R5-41 TaxID=2048654 RepID=UPI000C1292F1|nr:HDOD domain-containing protein [Solibacillus sp. R5-41]ATP41749.1 EAL domain-containing protein [Solibacillus sp. R5-41]